MDDIVGTERTFKQLVKYFGERLGESYARVEIRFVFLFTPRVETIADLGPYLLSQDQLITRDYKPIELEAVTAKSDLPYRKSIHYGSITPSPERDESGSPMREAIGLGSSSTGLQRTAVGKELRSVLQPSPPPAAAEPER